MLSLRLEKCFLGDEESFSRDDERVRHPLHCPSYPSFVSVFVSIIVVVLFVSFSFCFVSILIIVSVFILVLMPRRPSRRRCPAARLASTVLAQLPAPWRSLQLRAAISALVSRRVLSHRQRRYQVPPKKGKGQPEVTLYAQPAALREGGQEIKNLSEVVKDGQVKLGGQSVAAIPCHCRDLPLILLSFCRSASVRFGGRLLLFRVAWIQSHSLLLQSKTGSSNTLTKNMTPVRCFSRASSIYSFADNVLQEKQAYYDKLAAEAQAARNAAKKPDLIKVQIQCNHILVCAGSLWFL